MKQFSLFMVPMFPTPVVNIAKRLEEEYLSCCLFIQVHKHDLYKGLSVFTCTPLPQEENNAAMSQPDNGVGSRKQLLISLRAYVTFEAARAWRMGSKALRKSNRAQTKRLLCFITNSRSKNCLHVTHGIFITRLVMALEECMMWLVRS